ncbi:MAG TPA: hypothetical protein VMB48_13640 [Steroidobacteraceae bacterium]|nr:hypothetical protein [Steroidobacteraceae bacterium]
MSDYEFTISLRIRHPTIDPCRITDAIGLEPQHTWKAGDPRRDPEGGQLDGVFRESYWTGRLMGQPQLSSGQLSVESVLIQILAHLRRAQGFLDQLHAEGGVAEVHVSLFSRANFRLEWPPELVAGFGRIRAAIILEVYPHFPRDVALDRS